MRDDWHTMACLQCCEDHKKNVAENMEKLYRTLLNKFNVRDKHTHHDIPDKRNYQWRVQRVFFPCPTRPTQGGSSDGLSAFTGCSLAEAAACCEFQWFWLLWDSVHSQNQPSSWVLNHAIFWGQTVKHFENHIINTRTTENLANQNLVLQKTTTE